MPDFDMETPKAHVTDPDDLKVKGAGFPVHLYRFKAVNKDGSTPKGCLVVAWDGEEPIVNELLVATDADALALKLADGWSATPVLKASKKA